MAELRMRVRYFAAAKAAAGTAQEDLAVHAGATVHDVLTVLGTRHGEELIRVLKACSFLLDGRAVRDREAVLTDGDELDVLPPFAGG
jgi:molybdopterin synthase sulfur carrier subunit